MMEDVIRSRMTIEKAAFSRKEELIARNMIQRRGKKLKLAVWIVFCMEYVKCKIPVLVVPSLSYVLSLKIYHSFQGSGFVQTFAP